jgi:hypothetical protein
MRFWFFNGLLAVLSFTPFAFPQSAGDRTAAISGVVKGADDATPVVYLESGDDNPTRYYDGYKVSAEKDGSFSFADIKPGTYRLRAEAVGFMTAASDGAGAEIVLHPNEKRKDVTVSMVRRRAVCGRVTENGKSKATFMNAFRYDPEFGTLLDTEPPSTDTDGSFWISDLDPGTYYLRAGMTWYPGSFSFNGATPITVGPDPTPAKCIFDIPLQYNGCHGTKVTGQIATSSNGDSTRYRVNFLERNLAGGTMPTVIAMNLSGPYSAGDTFSGTVCSGDYDVVLNAQQGNLIFDSKRVSVGQTEIDGLVLTPRPMASIAGEIHFEGITRQASCPGLGGQGVRIERMGDGESLSAALDKENHFHFQNVAPGDYRIYLSPFLREAVYVKSITVAGKAIEERGFSIPRAEPVTMEITLSGDLAHVAGHISPDLRREHRWEVAWTRPKGSVAGKVHGDAEGGYTVKLLSARYNSNVSAEFATHTSLDGTFQFDSVDPGVYRLQVESKSSVTVEYGAQEAGQLGIPITVGRAARLKDFEISPPRLSAICGTVTDPNGAPRVGMRIFIETFQYGSLRGRDDTGEVVTDSTGHFHAEKLLPGEYYVVFPSGDRVAAFSNDGGLSAAEPIRLRVGESVGCAGTTLNFRIPAGAEQRHAVSGEIAGDLPKAEGDRFWVTLLWDMHDASGEAYAATAKVDDEHKFRIDRVPNGRFLVQLHSAYGPEPMTWSGPYGPVSHLLATQAIEVRDQDIVDLKIIPVRLPSVSGTVHFEHLPTEWKAFDISTQFITLVPTTSRAPFSAKLSAEGSFNIDPEDPGDYEVTLNQLRAPLYVRSVMLDGHEVTGRYLRLSASQAAHLDVFVSGDAGRVTASVSPDASLPMAEPSVTETCGSRVWPGYQLILFPDSLTLTEADSSVLIKSRVIRGYPFGYADHPSLEAGGVPPGRYRAVAAEHIWEAALFGRSDPLTKDEKQMWIAIASLGQPLTVQAGARLDVVLPDRTIDVARLAAKFGISMNANGFIVP